MSIHGPPFLHRIHLILQRISAFPPLSLEKTSHLPAAVEHPGVFFLINKSLCVPIGFSVTAKAGKAQACFLIVKKQNLETGRWHPMSVTFFFLQRCS